MRYYLEPSEAPLFVTAQFRTVIITREKKENWSVGADKRPAELYWLVVDAYRVVRPPL